MGHSSHKPSLLVTSSSRDVTRATAVVALIRTVFSNLVLLTDVFLQNISFNILEESVVSDDVVSPGSDALRTEKYFSVPGFVGLMEQAAQTFSLVCFRALRRVASNPIVWEFPIAGRVARGGGHGVRHLVADIQPPERLQEAERRAQQAERELHEDQQPGMSWMLVRYRVIIFDVCFYACSSL